MKSELPRYVPFVGTTGRFLLIVAGLKSDVLFEIVGVNRHGDWNTRLIGEII